MLADLYHQLTVDDEVDLLTRVGRQLDLVLVGVRVELALDVQRLGNTILKRVSEVIVGHAVCLTHLLSPASAGNGVGFQVRREALDDIGDVDVEYLCAAIDEREVQILFAGFTGDVFVLGNVGEGRHLGDRAPLKLS